MAKKKERDFTFHIDQETLFEDIEIFAPLSKQHELFINDDENSIIAYGGGSASGKSHCSLLKLMIDCIEQPGYNALLARESLVQLKSPGSLWEEGSRMFDHVGVSSNQINNQWRFPNKALRRWVWNSPPELGQDMTSTTTGGMAWTAPRF